MAIELRERIGHCPGCGQEIKRISFHCLLDEWRNCEFCGKRISIPGDLTKKIKLVFVRVGDKVKVPKHMLPLIPHRTARL